MLDYRPRESILNTESLELAPPTPESQPQLSSATQKQKPSLLQRFYNLSIARKTQLIPWVTFVVVGGIVGVGAVLIVAEGRTQLFKQSRAELSLTEVNYNLKINQMGFGFRGQSENPIIIAAAKASAQGQTLTPVLRNQLKQILQGEAKARDIEYATLVGKNLQIIANANRDRTGEIFNPNNLVSEVLSSSQQIKTSAIVSGAELAKESPVLPPGVVNQDVLIRYVVTPVIDPATKKIIGTLVSGDIVNGKLPIVEATLKAFDGGYSAVYLRKSAHEFALATALDNVDGRLKPNVNLPSISLLEAADKLRGLPVTGRINLEGQTYTTAAKALLDFDGEPLAILVRGTPETELNALLIDSLSIQLLLAALGLGVVGFLATILRQAIAKPVQQLQRTAQEFSQGDRQIRAEVLNTDEIGQLATTFNQMADSIAINEVSLKEQSRRKERYSYQSQLYAEIANYRVGEFQDLEPLFNRAVEGAREILTADRAVVYLFNSDWSGYITAESVLSVWPSALGNKIQDACISQQLLEGYRNGRVVPTNLRQVFTRNT